MMQRYDPTISYGYSAVAVMEKVDDGEWVALDDVNELIDAARAMIAYVSSRPPPDTSFKPVVDRLRAGLYADE